MVSAPEKYRCFFFPPVWGYQIGFAVTKKDAGSNWKATFGAVWVFLLYYTLIAAGVIVNLVRLALGHLGTDEILAQVRGGTRGDECCDLCYVTLGEIDLET